MEAKVVAYLHPATLQGACGSNEGLDTEQADYTSHPVALDCKPTLCLWSSQCGTNEAENQDTQRRVRG